MKFSKVAVHVALLVVGTLTLAGLAQAQYRTSIQGVVTDTSGAVVPGATLTLTNPATGEKQVRTSNDAGVFNFNALAASARFRLEVEKSGFRSKVLDHVDLIPDQANALNLQLEVGTTSQTVTVDASALPPLETETASTSGVISDNQIQHLPSFGRDVIKVAALALGSFGENAQGANGGSENLPGTQTGGGASGGSDGIFQTENGAQVVANGSQTENNGIMIDGISTTSAVWGGSTVVTPSEDSVESVKIVSNSYDAEDGRFNGAQIKITSKSGSNQVHGSAFFTAHRPGLNAYQPYNGGNALEGYNPVTRDDNFFDQFGGSIGGPIWKNKVFAFFAYETVRSPAAQNTQSFGWYDTPAFDALAPTGSISSKYLTFPGSGVVSKGINPNATCTLAGLTEGVDCRTIPGEGLNIGSPLTTGLGTQDPNWLSATSPGVGGGLSNVADIAEYITTSPSTYSKAQYNGRLDADATSKDHLGFAIYWVPQSSTFLNGPAREYNFFHHSQINDAFSVIWNHTFSPSFLNEARVNAAGWRWNEIADNPQSPVGLPDDQIDGIGTITISSFGPSVGSILDQWTYSYKDVATKIIGRHTIKFGGEATRLFYLQDCQGCGVPSYNFFNLWDFLNDAPQSEGGGFNPKTGAPTTIRQDQRENILGFFAQDDLKLRKNLTLNLGLRWSYFGPLYSKEGNMLQAVPGAGSSYLTGLVIRKGNSWNAQKDNFGPELGFAWSPELFKDRLVVRGGYGLNYNQEQIAISANISNNPGLVVFPSLSISTPSSPNPGIIYATSADVHNLNAYPANPNTVLSFGSNGLPVGGVGLGVEIFPGTLPTMLAHHYSLDTQYDLGHQWVMTLGYQGSLSRNTFFHENPNAVPAAEGYALNPQIGGGDYWSVKGSGNYNAMLTELKHDFTHSFLADAQFTFSRGMDTASSPYSTSFPPYTEPLYPYKPSLNYGRSDFNVAKSFKLFGVYQPVFFHGSKGWIEKIAGGWSLSPLLNIHSGFPWYPVASVNGGSLYCGTCGYTALLPAAYLGGAGNSTSNSQFKTGSNYPLVASQGNASAYFATPAYTAYSGTTYGNSLPQAPGVKRNSLTGPGYRDVDITLAKAFGLPSNKVLGENAKLEFRLDAYNLFNTLNLNPTSISNNINSSTFGQATGALGGRTATLGARFSF
jgi:hypothetical protein